MYICVCGVCVCVCVLNDGLLASHSVLFVVWCVCSIWVRYPDGVGVESAVSDWCAGASIAEGEQ